MHGISVLFFLRVLVMLNLVEERIYGNAVICVFVKIILPYDMEPVKAKMKPTLHMNEIAVKLLVYYVLISSQAVAV